MLATLFFAQNQLSGKVRGITLLPAERPQQPQLHDALRNRSSDTTLDFFIKCDCVKYRAKHRGRRVSPNTVNRGRTLPKHVSTLSYLTTATIRRAGVRGASTSGGLSPFALGDGLRVKSLARAGHYATVKLERSLAMCAAANTHPRTVIGARLAHITAKSRTGFKFK